MKVSLLIIVAFLCVYTTWVQKTAREAMSSASVRVAELEARLRCSESARVFVESALAEAKDGLEKDPSRSGSGSKEASGVIADSSVNHPH